MASNEQEGFFRFGSIEIYGEFRDGQQELGGKN